MRVRCGVIGAALGMAGIWSLAVASTVEVDLNDEHQVIRGFGGMVHNAWQGGGGLSEADAKIAFGTGDGTIGLNTLRIPVYASSNDFSKEVQAAKYAKAAAGDDFILYATPWTSDYAGAGQHIAESNYQKYVDHLNDFTAYMKNQGVPLYAISISNEPDWCGEWACWTADEIYNFTKNYADQMRKNGTKVISTESFAYQKSLYDQVLKDADALKNWDILGAHFYASTRYSEDSFFQYTLADDKNVERWMTEHYTESQGSGNDWRVMRNTGDQATANKQDTVNAIDVGYEIHRAMVVGNFSQYTWWYIRRCYGLIMETDFSGKLTIPDNEIGKISKRGYVLSQFARFVRPGAVRVGATAKPESGLFASAYKSAGGDSLIVVLVNRDYTAGKTVTISVPGVSKLENFHMYTTSEAKNAKDEGYVDVTNGSVTITMESGASNKDCIVTLVGEIGDVVKTPREPYSGVAVEIPGKIEAENFDIPGTGRENKTYNENDADDHGAESNDGKSYREGTGVDIYKKATGYVVGYNQEGEWLEYSVNVKEAGDYTFFAAVASGNATSSFQMSLDGETLTDVISVPQNEGENNFDDYGYVKQNVTLPAGEHILRFTVTSSWMDVDFFTFVKGKDATDPESLGGTTLAKAHFALPTEAENYRIFDMNGGYIGMVRAAGAQELRRAASGLVKCGGAYLAKSASGRTMRLQVSK